MDKEYSTGYLEDQFILRLPLEVARQVRQQIKDRNLEGLEFVLDADHKHGKFFQSGKEFKMRLVNLPTIIEAHKTTDRKVFFKSGDVHQMLVVEDPEQGFQDADVPAEQRRRWQFELDPKKWEADSGLTPPTHKIKQRKWRKMPEYTKAEISEAEEDIMRIQRGQVVGEEIEIIKADEYEAAEAAKTGGATAHSSQDIGGASQSTGASSAASPRKTTFNDRREMRRLQAERKKARKRGDLFGDEEDEIDFDAMDVDEDDEEEEPILDDDDDDGMDVDDDDEPVAPKKRSKPKPVAVASSSSVPQTPATPLTPLQTPSTPTVAAAAAVPSLKVSFTLGAGNRVLKINAGGGATPTPTTPVSPAPPRPTTPGVPPVAAAAFGGAPSPQPTTPVPQAPVSIKQETAPMPPTPQAIKPEPAVAAPVPLPAPASVIVHQPPPPAVVISAPPQPPAQPVVVEPKPAPNLPPPAPVVAPVVAPTPQPATEPTFTAPTPAAPSSSALDSVRRAKLVSEIQDLSNKVAQLTAQSEREQNPTMKSRLLQTATRTKDALAAKEAELQQLDAQQ
eukprot:TRINITY_DN2367_c0_g1_i1.p1 TRINITY_DN2367_c0_g1~~TRINITY_DN2367_c0_g1_i1.p1  ORF type:complete len:562 (+),score=166.09 TRINITY_DN2367_c0_g1_i1:56-1741(+)